MLKTKASKKDVNPRKTGYVDTPSGRKLVKFFAKEMHLQTLVKYILPDGEIVGAMLLNKGSVSSPDYKLRFGWDTEGFHHLVSPDEAEAITTSVSAIAEEVLSGQRLRFCFESFGDDLPVREELLDLLGTCPESLLPFVQEDLEINERLHQTGECRPKSLHIWGDYSENESQELDTVERLISKVTSFGNKISGADKAIEQQSIDQFLMKGYEYGYLGWSSLFRQKLTTGVRAMSPERILSKCSKTLNRFGDIKNPQPLPPLPQVIVVDLQKDKIWEEISTIETPLNTLLNRVESVPDTEGKNSYFKLDGKYVGGFYLANHPTEIKASGTSTAAQNALQYLWKWFGRSRSKNMEVVVEIYRPSASNVDFVAVSNAKESKGKKKEKDKRGIISERDDEDLKEALQAIRENKPVVEFALAAFLYCDTKAELSAASPEFQRYFNPPAKLHREIHYVFPLWSFTRPYSANVASVTLAGFRDHRDRTGSDFIPVVLPVLSTHSPHKSGLQFVDIDGGAPFRFDPLKNPGHTAIYGTSGSGKTLILDALIYRARALLIPVVALDFTPTGDASSFQDFAEAKGGVYFDVLRHRINILETPEVSEDASEEKINDAAAATRNFQQNILMTIVLGAALKSTEYDTLEVGALIGMLLERFWSDPIVLDHHRLAREGGINSNEWQQYPVLYKKDGVCLTRYCTVSHLDIPDPTTKQREAINFIKERLESFAVTPNGAMLNKPSSFSLQNDMIVLAMRGKLGNDLAAVYGSLMFNLAYRKATEASQNLGSVTVVDESNIIFENDSIAIQAGVTTSVGRKAGMRMILCAQTPSSVLDSAGGSSFRANFDYKLIGKIEAPDAYSYTSTKYLNLPETVIQPNFGFQKPTRDKGYSQWLVIIEGVMTHGKIYLPPSLLYLGSNSIREVKERRNQKEQEFAQNPQEELVYAS
jgi:hypothetical protein